MPLSPPKAPTRIANLSPPDGEPSLDTLGDTSGDLLKVLSRFQKGVGLSVWQNNGDDNSNWTRHSSTNWPCNLSAATGMQKYEQCPDFLNRYKEDIGLAKKLGCTSFRLSLEWARIEPVRGQFDAVTIQRYHDIFDYLAEAGLEPNITLHHFVHPGWFEDLGAFTKDANIPVFVAWAVKAFELFGPRIKMWSTFNEPTVREHTPSTSPTVYSVPAPVTAPLSVGGVVWERSGTPPVGLQKLRRPVVDVG